MSKTRQSDADELIRSFGLSFDAPRLNPPRSEAWHQLIYASKGVLKVHAATGAWVVPPHRSVWVPAGIESRLEMSGPTALRMLYFPVQAIQNRTMGFEITNCAVLHVTPLLRELILRVVEIGALKASVAPHRHLARVIVDELQQSKTLLPMLPTLRSPLTRAFQDALEHQQVHDLEPAVRSIGASRRTLERAIQQEAGMSLGRWIRAWKVQRSLVRLWGGHTVADVAFELGYSSPSAFITMFQQELGISPGRYVTRTL